MPRRLAALSARLRRAPLAALALGVALVVLASAPHQRHQGMLAGGVAAQAHAGHAGEATADGADDAAAALCCFTAAPPVSIVGGGPVVAPEPPRALVLRPAPPRAPPNPPPRAA